VLVKPLRHQIISAQKIVDLKYKKLFYIITIGDKRIDGSGDDRGD
jgi:hypothetical protein